MTLSFHPLLEGDITDAADYYSQFDPVLPGRFRADLKESLDSIVQFPFMGAVVMDGYRRISLRVFPYMVVYRAFDSTVRVLAVVHARRDPAWAEHLVRGRVA